jgi:hypothetical protein
MRINVRVIPRSGKNLIEWEEGGLKVRLTAPPIVLGDVPLDAILHLHKPMHDRTYSLEDSGFGSTSVCQPSCTMSKQSGRCFQ